MNKRFLDTLSHKATDRPPIWMMRQAGRYLPEYQATRQKAGDFLTLCKTPELACEVTLQPLRRFPLDAAILFSDILTIPDAMGLGLHFDDKGPTFTSPLRDVKAIDNLPNDVTSDTGYVFEALKLIHHELKEKLPIIGFTGSPWTLATYMVEGRLTKSFEHIKRLRYSHPEALDALLHTLALNIRAYLKAQVQAGADALMIFDSWGGMLTQSDYQRFSHHPIQTILEEDYGVPTLLFTKGGGQWLHLQRALPCTGFGIDWTLPLRQARQILGPEPILQGNFDPTFLLGDPKYFPSIVSDVLEGMANDPHHIINLGHGILPATPIDHVHAWFEALFEYYQVAPSQPPLA